MKLEPQHLPAPSRRHDHGACADLTMRLLAQTGTVAEPDGTPAPVETFPRWGQTPTAAASTGAEPAVTPPSTAPQRPAEPAVTPPSTAPQRPATAPPATPDPTPDPTPARASASAETWLAEALSDGPRTVAELKDAAKAAGISQRTLYRAAQKLSVVRDRVGGNRALWQLPELRDTGADWPQGDFGAALETDRDTGADELRDEGAATDATDAHRDAPAAAQEPTRARGADPAPMGTDEPGGDRAALLDALSALELAGEALSRAARLVRHYLPEMEGTP